MPRTRRPWRVVAFEDGELRRLPYHLTDGEQQRTLILGVFMAVVVAVLLIMALWLIPG